MIVQKYGGTSVADVDRIKAIAKHVADIKKRGHDIVVVASAMGKTTNALIQLAKEVGYANNDREMDSLLSTGEQQTVTLLAMAIEALGDPVCSRDILITYRRNKQENSHVEAFYKYLTGYFIIASEHST